jgi:hypothetical protein
MTKWPTYYFTSISRKEAGPLSLGIRLSVHSGNFVVNFENPKEKKNKCGTFTNPIWIILSTLTWKEKKKEFVLALCPTAPPCTQTSALVVVVGQVPTPFTLHSVPLLSFSIPTLNHILLPERYAMQLFVLSAVQICKCELIKAACFDFCIPV